MGCAPYLRRCLSLYDQHHTERALTLRIPVTPNLLQNVLQGSSTGDREALGETELIDDRVDGGADFSPPTHEDLPLELFVNFRHALE